MRLLATPNALVAAVPPPRCAAPRCVRDDLPAAVRQDLAALCNAGNLQIGTVEPSDMPACIDILMDSFYKDMLTLAAGEFSEEELTIITPTLEKLNGVFTRFSRAVLSFDTARRVGGRLQSGGVRRAPGETLLLAVRSSPDRRVLGVVELSEQPRDGRVPGDVRLPQWATRAPTVPYVASLAIARDSRRKGLGRALVRACESIACREWGHDAMFLHCTTSNEQLLEMYRGFGYQQLPGDDQPGWVLALSGREATRYHTRPLDLKTAEAAGAQTVSD